MKKLTIAVAFLIFCCLTVFAQDQTKMGRPTAVGMATLPSSPTVATTLNMFADYIYLSNHSASTVTVTMKDQSTNCNGAACQPVPTISIAANTIYAIPAYGVPFLGGVVWSCSAAGAVDAWIAGRY